jgi:cardiolipin synthase A/B
LTPSQPLGPTPPQVPGSVTGGRTAARVRGSEPPASAAGAEETPHADNHHAHLRDRVAEAVDTLTHPSRSLLPGIPALKAHLPPRGTRAGRVARTLMYSSIVTGAGLGAAVAGPLGGAIGAAVGLLGGALGGHFLLQPGWVDKKVERVRETLAPEGRDVDLTPVSDSPLLTKATEAALDERTGTRATEGNRVRLLTSGAASFEARFRLMEAAEHTINLQTYIMHDDETGQRTAELLCRKAREGVEVRVLVDALGSGGTSSAFFDTMRQAGVKVCEYNPPLSNLGRINQRWHQKMLTVDDQVAIVGGMNIGSEYALAGSGRVDVSQGSDSPSAMWMNDTDVAQAGPGAADIVRAFGSNWQVATGETLAPPTPPDVTATPRAALSLDAPEASAWGFLSRATHEVEDVKTRFLTHRPVEDGDNRIEDWYVTMLDGASKTAYLTNAYFVPTPRLCDALKRAASRGVDVRLLTNSPETNDSVPMPQMAGRASYEELLQAGVRIYEAVDRGAVLRHLHKKVAVFDGVASTIGSANLDPRSATLNSEDTLCIDDPRVGRRLEEMFEMDLKRSREIDMKVLHGGTVLDRFEQWLYGDVVRPVL